MKPINSKLLTSRLLLLLLFSFFWSIGAGQLKTTNPSIQIKVKNGKIIQVNLINTKKSTTKSVSKIVIGVPDSAVFDAKNFKLKAKTAYPKDTSVSPIKKLAATSTTIMSEGFEEVWPGTTGWNAYSNTDGLDIYWDDNNFRSYSGNWSAWCAAGGTDASSSGENYKNNMNAWMVYGPFSLSDATSALLSYKLWYNTELNVDKIKCFASTNGFNYYGIAYSGNSNGWVSNSFDLSNVYTLGNLCGSSQVWIAFNFTSDSANVFPGVYIDDILLQKNIVELPDLQPIDISLPSSDLTVGDSIIMGLTEINNGNCAAGAHSSQLYLSSNTLISASDTPLGVPIYFTTILAGNTQTNAVRFKMPDVVDGNYYIGAISDINNEVIESDETNNAAYLPNTLTIDHPILSRIINVSPTNLTINEPESEDSINNSLNDNNRNDIASSNEHSTGLIIPDEIKAYWEHNAKSLKYNEKALASSVDWSINDSPVKDQGTCGACWAFSTIGLIENLASVKYDLAEQTLVSCVTLSNGCDGGWYGYALEYINTMGVPSETCQPYSQTNGNCSDRCSNPNFLIKVYNFNKFGQWGVPTTSTVNDLKALLNTGPVLVSMNVPSDGSFNSYKCGIYDYTGGPFSGGGHAVEVVGYNDAEQWFKVKNSWGKNWGENGYFRISYNDVTGYVQFGGYACTASGVYKVDNNGDSIVISNKGDSVLEVSSMLVSKPWLTLSSSSVPFNLTANQTSTIKVTVDWNLLTVKTDTATITIGSNDPDNPSVLVTVTANKAVNIPNVSTNAVSAITSSTATSGGIITADGGDTISARGICWGLNLNPTINDTKTNDGSGSGAFTSYLTGLNSSEMYHIRAYATNSAGTSYGDDISFITSKAVFIPTIYTNAVSAITSSTATSGGIITADGGDTISARGICWSLNLNPTINDTKTDDGSGSGAFTSYLTGLTSSEMYHIRAYATNSAGTSYGDDISFITSKAVFIPTIYTNAVSAITSSTATSGGIITADGGDTISARGICWSLNLNPTINDTKTDDGSGSGAFTSYLTGLTSNEMYHIRAYATNSAGIAYGDDISFTAITTGTKNVSKESVTIFPDPTTNTFQISGIEGKATLTLTDINGRLMLTKEVTDNESISITTLPMGIYIVCITTTGGTVQKKLIKR